MGISLPYQKMALLIPNHFKFRPPNPLQPQLHHPHPQLGFVTVRTRNSNSCYLRKSSFSVRASDDGGAVPRQHLTSEVDALRKNSSSAISDNYVAVFVRMLGLDNDPLDRELAIVTVWKYSLGGKSCIDNLMQFSGVLSLTVNLLNSNADSACEAAAGLLRMISSIDAYRITVAESGAIEEITGLLRRSSLSVNVLEQSLGTLWNLSADENLRGKITNPELLPLLINSLKDEDIKVKEKAAAVLANLALSHSSHNIMVEAGVIPALANLVKSDDEGFKAIRKEARNALLEIAKDDYYRILLLEEGLVSVPLIGADAYKSFKPALYSWPSLPDGSKIEQKAKGPSRYGASELLIGLNDQDSNLDEAKRLAIVGRTQQQFLARIGAIEIEDGDKSNPTEPEPSCQRFTLLPWVDGVARLVLILGLDDDSAVSRAADSIAGAAINEHMRESFKEAGAIRNLSQLLHHPKETVRLPVIQALERLSVSNCICQIISAEGVVYPLIDSLMHLEISETSTEMILNILTRILDPAKEMKSKFYDGPVNGSRREWNAARDSQPGHINETTESKSASSQTMDVEEIANPAFLARLIGILKKPFPNLQKKAVSILEYFTVSEQCVDKIISADIAAGLDILFQKNYIRDADSVADAERPELAVLEIEEVGRAVSAACRLLTSLLDFEQFRSNIDIHHFRKLVRKILKSDISVHNKDWVAACLVKLCSLSGPNLDPEDPVNVDVALYEKIPRLIEQIKTSFSPEVQEAAVVELNRIISEGVVDSTRAVAAEGGIFPLVKMIEEGSERAIEAGLAILYNLSMDTENHAAIIAAGAVPVLRRIVLTQKPQWTQALHLLRVLPT